MEFILPALALLCVFGLLFLWLVVTGRRKRAQESGYKHISPKQAKQKLSAEDDIVLLDVRSRQEHNVRHIPGSMLIPLDRLGQEAPSKLPGKDRTIFVYCETGRRSVEAARALARLGYTRVHNLGGIRSWPYETK